MQIENMVTKCSEAVAYQFSSATIKLNKIWNEITTNTFTDWIGLGRGCGAVFGGFFVKYFGTTTTFRGYGMCTWPQKLVEKLIPTHTIQFNSISNSLVSGVICTFVLGGFIFINFYRKEHGFVTDIPQTEDPHQVRFDFRKTAKNQHSKLL